MKEKKTKKTPKEDSGDNINSNTATAENSSEKSQIENPKTEKSSIDQKKYEYVIKNRKIRKHEKQRKLIKFMLIFLGITIFLGGGVYGMLTMLEYNNFKVLIDKEGLNILSLSHSEDFVEPTQVLSLQGPRYMDNITLLDVYHLLPEIEATEGNYGEREEKNFVASTFYLRNISDRDQYIREAMVINDVTKDVNEAIRVLVIRNSQKTVYAEIGKDGEPEEVVPDQYFTSDGDFTDKPEEVWMTTPFSSPRHVFYDTGIPLAAGETRKYTIMIWLEGWDPECVNDILGGTIKLEFQFTKQSV